MIDQFLQTDQPLLIEEGRTFSRAKVAERIDAVAAIVSQMTEAGSVVGVTIDNRIESVELYLGVQKAGCQALPIPAYLPTAAQEAMLRHARGHWSIGLGTGVLDPSAPGYERSLAWAGKKPSVWGEGGVFFSSSGTEDDPRLYYYNFSNLFYWLASRDLHAIGYDTDARILCNAPMAGGGGLITVLNAIAAGGTVVLDNRRPDPAVFAEVVNRHSVTSSTTRPRSIGKLLDAGMVSRDVPSLRSLTSTSAPLPRDMQARYLDAFPETKLFDIYSTTETGQVSVRHVTEALNSEGIIVPGVEVDIRNADEDGVGEIWVRSKGTMYAQMTPVGPLKPEYGWVSPGDFGYVESGRLVLSGRRSDKLLVSGFTVFAGAVEEAIRLTPGVQEVAVIGCPDEDKGQSVQAFVVGAATERDILDTVKRHLPYYAIPEVRQVKNLPLSPAGKVLKRGLVA
jgi:long-chain acyl-CoA synthetase